MLTKGPLSALDDGIPTWPKFPNGTKDVEDVDSNRMRARRERLA